MRVMFLLIYMITILSISSMDIGGAYSLDFYNNPVVNSAPSPVFQQRPTLFYNLTIGLFNLRSGIGITEANYQISVEDGVTPVFNDMFVGFYTLEFDVFAKPGVVFTNDNLDLGVSVGGGVRLPILTKVDPGLDQTLDVGSSFNWFYSDLRFIFLSSDLFLTFKLPKSDTTRFYCSLYYKDFIFRVDQWVVGATTGLLWHI